VESNQPADSIIVYATSAGSVAADGEGRNGLFTGQLLKHLTTPGLEVAEVFRLTGFSVMEASGRAQIPAVYNQFFGQAYLGTRPGVPPVQTVSGRREQSVPENMVYVEGGSFMMGSPDDEPNRMSDETQHQVTVSGFYMGKYEVTQKEWREVMGSHPSEFKGDDLPVENVSWYDVLEYCNALSKKDGFIPAYLIDRERIDSENTGSFNWLVSWDKNANGYRLPTEAEWEYACRAGTVTPFSTGNDITTDQANYDGDYPYNNNKKGIDRKKTTIVGSFAPNQWGLYDMHGNIREWCWDWYYFFYSTNMIDPTGSSGRSSRVIRGGSWFDVAGSLTSADRDGEPPFLRYSNLGFRVVRSSL
jgi:formylglycine-generating enzyme required for sulfatase activity